MHLFEDPQAKLLGVNTLESFRAVVKDIKEKYPNPDFMLLTGDLAQDETVGAYENLIESLAIFNCPKYGIPGNHDDEGYMLEVFKANHLQENREIITDHWNIILLNTQKPHAVEGFLTEEQLDFLDMSLGRHPEHHALIFMHHPPIKVGSEWLDKWMLSNADEFWKVLKPYHHVKSIVCGHVHQEFETQHENIPVLTTPSTCFQFLRNSKKFGVEALMPGYRLCTLFEDGTFETKVLRVSGFNLALDTSSGGY